MIIDPEECTECTSCYSACPIGAIVEGPDKDAEYGKVNAELAPSFKNNAAVPTRPANDAPKKPGNKLVN